MGSREEQKKGEKCSRASCVGGSVTLFFSNPHFQLLAQLVGLVDAIPAVDRKDFAAVIDPGLNER